MSSTRPVPPPREIPSLTALRGLLAGWVVAYHFGNDALRLFPVLDGLTPVVARGHLAVPGFFALSGFVLAYHYTESFRTLTLRSVGRFLGRRLARVYPVHLVTLLAVLAMVAVADCVGYQLSDGGYSAADFARNLLLVQTWTPDFRLNWNYPSWSVSSEWFAYLLFPAVATVATRTLSSARRAAAFGAASLAASVAVLECWRPWPFYELVLVVPTFFTGAAIWWAYRVTASGRLPLRITPEVCAVAAVVGCYWPVPELGTAVTVTGIVAVIAALARLGPSCHAAWRVRPVVLLGDVSYSLYLSHTLAQKVLVKLLPAARFEASPLGVKLAVGAAYLAAVALACLGTYHLVERPARRALRRAAG